VRHCQFRIDADHTATGWESSFIDFHGSAPLAVTPVMWEQLIERECDDGFGFVLKGRVNEFGYTSMTTPMTLRALDHALSMYRTMSLADVIKPAIDFYFNGFLVRPKVHAFWMQP